MIDRNLIETYAQHVETHEILRHICIPDARAKNPDGSPVDYLLDLPAIKDPLEQRAAFWKVRGIERHPDEFYPTYYALARVLKPKRIAEIGVWWGYALMAMVQGSLQSLVVQPAEMHVYGYDNESYPEAGSCLSWAAKAFDLMAVPSTMVHCSSRDFDRKGLGLDDIDMFSVDGEHSYEDALLDLQLAEPCMTNRPGATIIVDDVGWALNVRQAVEEFCREKGWDALWLPTLKGTAVLQRRSA
jgi:predicted O-methyltransferase YrrM